MWVALPLSALLGLALVLHLQRERQDRRTPLRLALHPRGWCTLYRDGDRSDTLLRLDGCYLSGALIILHLCAGDRTGGWRRLLTPEPPRYRTLLLCADSAPADQLRRLRRYLLAQTTEPAQMTDHPDDDGRR